MAKVIVLPKPCRWLARFFSWCRGSILRIWSRDPIGWRFAISAIAVGVGMSAILGAIVKSGKNPFWLLSGGFRYGTAGDPSKFFFGLVLSYLIVTGLAVGLFHTDEKRSVWWGIYLLLAALLSYLLTWRVLFGRF